MKYLKTYENVTNFKVEALTGKEFSELYWKLYPDQEIVLKDKIHYFSWNGVNSYLGSDKHEKSIRLITAFNEDDILGVCYFAFWEGTGHYSISYLSTNKDYFKLGISKKILDVLFQYFSETYPNETLNMSGYSIDGWKYLRKTILELSDKYNVKIQEKPIEYVTNWSDENRELFDKSREEIKKKYNLDDYY
jgi:hypothetical protein